MRGFFTKFLASLDKVLHQLVYGDKVPTLVFSPPVIIQPKPAPSMPEKTKGQKLYETAKALLGQHVIVLDASNQFGYLGCAQSVNAVVKKALGFEIGGGASTALMYSVLKDATKYMQVPYDEALPGDIVIDATGTSVKYPQAHGHVGVMGVRWIMSNSSETGTWEANYVKEDWPKYFTNIMGFPTRVYRIL